MDSKNFHKINEDFWDENEVEVSDDSRIENSDMRPGIRFLYSVTIYRYPQYGQRENNYENIAEKMNRYAKKAVHYINNSGIFSDIKYEVTDYYLKYRDAKEFETIIHVPLREFKQRIQYDIFGQHFTLRFSDATGSCAALQLWMEFSANIEFSRGRDAWNFFKNFLMPLDKNWRTFIKITPLYPDALQEQAYDGTIIFTRINGNYVERVPKGEFKEGMSVQINMDNDRVYDNDITILSKMFLDDRMTKQLKEIHTVEKKKPIIA